MTSQYESHKHAIRRAQRGTSVERLTRLSDIRDNQFTPPQRKNSLELINPSLSSVILHTAPDAILGANERNYVRFVEFLEPFSGWLARAVRIELLSQDLETYGEPLPDNEILELTDDDKLEHAEPRPLDWERSLQIQPNDSRKRLIARTIRFDVVIGEAIKIKACSLVGRPGSVRLRLPTSEGLKLRPIMLEVSLQHEIVRRAERCGYEPEPYAA